MSWAADVARSAADQRAWDAAAQDEEFLAWVDMNDAVLALELDDVVADLPSKPWGEAALRVAEAAALERFGSYTECFTTGHWEASWLFVRFIGQVFIDGCDGSWVNIPAQGKQRAQVAVRVPGMAGLVEPITMLTAAMHRRTGEEWSSVFRYAQQDHAAYLTERATRDARNMSDGERALLHRIVATVGEAALLAQLTQCTVIERSGVLRELLVDTGCPKSDAANGPLPMMGEWVEPQSTSSVC